MMRFNKILVITLFASVTTSTAWAGGLSKQMDSVFDGMTNKTDPQLIISQNRGVFTGGRYTAKSRIKHEKLLSLTPPSWKAGCNGIDMFGGSFSFIRSDELSQLFRAIGANTAGYVFMLGLDNAFPEGAKWIETMQRKIQALNQHLGDSCQLAQGLVNDLTSGADFKNKTDASLIATTEGIFGDFFSAKHANGGSSPMQALKSNKKEIYQGMIGNIVWKQLKKNRVDKWFDAGDDQLLEAMMSLTGTVIITDIGPNKNQENQLQMLPGNKITLNDIIEGGQFEIYSCEGDLDQCLSAGNGKTKKISLVGLRTKILELLQGKNGNDGIIAKYASNSGNMGANEAAFLANLPGGMGTIFRNLSVKSPKTSALFATESSAVLATAMAYDLADTLIRDTISAQINSDTPYKKEVMSLLERSQSNLRDELRVLSKSYGSLANQVTRYNALVKNIPSSQYLPFHQGLPNRKQMEEDKS